MVNEGKTCYIAAVAQVLVHTPPFVHALLSLSPERLAGTVSAHSYCSLLLCLAKGMICAAASQHHVALHVASGVPRGLEHHPPDSAAPFRLPCLQYGKYGQSQPIKVLHDVVKTSLDSSKTAPMRPLELYKTARDICRCAMWGGGCAASGEAAACHNTPILRSMPQAACALQAAARHATPSNDPSDWRCVSPPSCAVPLAECPTLSAPCAIQATVPLRCTPCHPLHPAASSPASSRTHKSSTSSL